MSDTSAAEARPANPIVVVRDYLEQRKNSYRAALPPHIDPDRFISAVMTAVQIQPDLLACDRRSLQIASLRCAQDGLLPDGREAALVPFKMRVTYQPMYQGLLKQFRNSGQFKWITANLVYQGDAFEHWIDENGEHFKHIPTAETEGKKIRCVYAIATTKDGGSFIEVLSPADIEKRRNMSRASRDDAPWKQWPDEMAKKTAIKALSKLLPKSSDLDAFLKRDEDEALGIDTSQAIAGQRGAAFGNVLDHFAATDAATSPAASTAEPVPAADGAQEEGSRSGETTGESRPPAAAEQITAAYERGKQARAAGHQRKALPPEYRDNAHMREALAWGAGFDGSDLPKWKE